MADDNAALRSTAADLSTADSPVLVAQTDLGWSAATMTWDGVHPNSLGETHLARRFMQALVATLAVPGLAAPKIAAVRTWQRYPAVRVVVRKSRAIVTWDTQATTGARVWMARTGQRARVTEIRGSSLGLRYRSPKLLKGARNVVRVALVRRAMATPYGPSVRVRVPGGRRH